MKTSIYSYIHKRRDQMENVTEHAHRCGNNDAGQG